MKISLLQEFSKLSICSYERKTCKKEVHLPKGCEGISPSKDFLAKQKQSTYLNEKTNKQTLQYYQEYRVYISTFMVEGLFSVYYLIH